ncbi:MAG: hypothetical protein KAJ33_00625 [Thermoplasmata archaeon]|nr:hypothetical protein [Thermoplasmata archaeon]MCK5396736.1 hypothetical protein [Thermoplasmata archaeon]
MREMWVRGIFFKQVLEYIQKNRGQTSYDLLGMSPDDYRVEERYDFEIFCKLLAKIDLMTGEDNGTYISKVARDTMTEEASWKAQFRKLDPKSIFMTTKRQEGRHQIADFEPQLVENSHVSIKMTMWIQDKVFQDLWANFYKGRLEGVMELMGRKGTVELIKEFGEGVYTYDINWE